MKKLLTLYFILFALSAGAQTKSIKKSPALIEASPEKVGMSSERLQRLDYVLQEAVENGDIPGVVALVAKDGKIVYHKAFGMADNEKWPKIRKKCHF